MVGTLLAMSLLIQKIPMKFGAHVSAASGLWNAPENAAKIGCEVLQMFSRPPYGGPIKPITPMDAQRFRDAMKECQIQRAYIHAPYTINLASKAPRIRFGSISLLRTELERGTLLGCRGVMFHPGSAKDVGEKKGVQMVIDGLDAILEGYRGSCQLLIEISAGAGMVIGDSFEEIAAFLKGTKRGKEIGVCFDTQHAFASGYDLRTKKDVEKTFALFDRLIGLKRLILSHCNDSKVEFGSHKDRHEHLGKGLIGTEGFKTIVRMKKLHHMDLILETPTQTGVKRDLKLLKSWRNAL